VDVLRFKPIALCRPRHTPPRPALRCARPRQHPEREHERWLIVPTLCALPPPDAARPLAGSVTVNRVVVGTLATVNVPL